MSEAPAQLERGIASIHHGDRGIRIRRPRDEGEETRIRATRDQNPAALAGKQPVENGMDEGDVLAGRSGEPMQGPKDVQILA
jgi:hypothetical protein